MKAVIDTNVLVSGLIKQGTPPAEVVADMLSGELTPLYDERIINEYREVLARPKFKLAVEQIQTLVDFIVADGLEVLGARFPGQLPDADDQPFADVAFTGQHERLSGWPVTASGDAQRLARHQEEPTAAAGSRAE